MPASAQPAIEWEQLGSLGFGRTGYVNSIDFLRGDGTGPVSLDTLVRFDKYNAFRYNPGGEGNTNGSHTYGDWYPMCRQATGCRADEGIVTNAGTLFLGLRPRRSTDRGRTWRIWPTVPTDGEPVYMEPIYEVQTLPLGPGPVIIAGTGFDGSYARSLNDGEYGTWDPIGTAASYPHGLGEVPPSPALPNGRLLAAGDYLTYSDDVGLTWHVAVQPQGLIKGTFAFLASASHPYGGVVYAGVTNLIAAEGGALSGAEVYRSDDGGASWTLAHLFTPEETGQPTDYGYGYAHVNAVVYATPDGTLWAAANAGAPEPPPPSIVRGTIMRSTDGGETWSRADGTTYAAMNNGHGMAVYQFLLARDGRLYAATDDSVWRTTTPVVTAAEADPAPPSVGLRVRPNPSRGAAVTLSLEAPDAIPMATVRVYDTLGRTVAEVYSGPVSPGERTFVVGTAGWSSGTYTAQVFIAGRARGYRTSARFTVAR